MRLSAAYAILELLPAKEEVKNYDTLDLGEVFSCGFAAEPPRFDTGGRVRGVRRAGQVYEWKAQEYFCQRYDCYLRSPWLVFRSRTSPQLQWCQPDGLLFVPERRTIIICEIKLKHTPDAYWQVKNLYEPVLRAIFKGRSWSFRALEIVKWYDPLSYFPVDPQLVQDPLLTPRGEGMGVHIWAGK